MSVVWQLRLKSAAGAYVAIIDDWRGFAFTSRVNAVGAWTLQIDAYDSDVSEIELDGQIEFWWRDQARGIAWRSEFAGLVRDIAYYLTETGEMVCEVSGRGYNDLLDRRIVAAAAGSANGTKSGKAETILKAWVNEQAGPGAGARAITGLSIQADAAGGNTIAIAAAYDNLLALAQDVAAIGGGDFAVVGTGAALWEFRWYAGQFGTDRHLTVVFNVGNGNMANPRLSVSRHNEVNAVLVAGQGEGAARTTTWRTDATRIAESPINRREMFRDARQEATSGGLENLGDIRLEEGRPKKELTFDIVQTEGCTYGVHYALGDLVSAEFMEARVTKKVVAVTITVNAQGEQRQVETANV